MLDETELEELLDELLTLLTLDVLDELDLLLLTDEMLESELLLEAASQFFTKAHEPSLPGILWVHQFAL